MQYLLLCPLQTKSYQNLQVNQKIFWVDWRTDPLEQKILHA